jgi:hypothetical protein
MAHYRWLPSTVIPNIRWAIHDFTRGVWNVARWTPVIWSDADFDWHWLSKILKYKLTRMAKIDAATEGYDHCARKMLIAVEILKRLEADEKPDGLTFKEFLEHQKDLDRYFGKMMSNIRCWWD